MLASWKKPLSTIKCNTSPQSAGMPMQKGVERGEVFAQHFPNTSLTLPLVKLSSIAGQRSSDERGDVPYSRSPNLASHSQDVRVHCGR